MVDPHLAYPCAHWLDVAEVAGFLDAENPGIDAGLRLSILQLAEPLLIGIAFANFKHRRSVIHDLQTFEK